MISFWLAVTRLGEAQLLLPALLGVTVWLAWRAGAARTAALWWATTAAATLVTTVSKLAFIGWEVGYAPLDFTGFSGHAMFAAAVMPLLAREAVSEGHPRWRGPAVAAGLLLAAVVAYSRARIGAHSMSEAVAGFALGAVASGIALAAARLPAASAPKALIAGIVAWAAFGGIATPTLPTHGWVTALAVAWSGREQPYTREEMLADWRQRQQLQRWGLQ